MADSSLDEFFAKKDRSKKKAKSKFTTSDSIAKKREDSVTKKVDVSKRESKEKSSQLSTAPSSNSSNLSEQDDEWKDIEDEKERDYSGLRIQALSISEKEKEEELFKEQMIDENGELCILSEGQSGPWKAVNVPPPPPVIEEKEIEIEPKEEDTNSSKPQAYVPPGRRAASTTSSPSNALGSRKHGSKLAPEISSEVHFPTLSSSAADNKMKNNSDMDPSFQSVKHGIKSKNETHELRLDLGNRFSFLHQGN